MQNNAAFSLSIIAQLASLVLLPILSQAQTERYCKEQFCRSVGGITERKYPYGDGNHIFIDCDAKRKVYEGGLDKRARLESINRAAFAGHISGKKEAVVIYDTDGREGPYENQIRKAAKRYGIEYISFRCEW